MEVFIEPIGRLMNEFSKLPGVGKKTAQRYAYRVINMSEAEARAFADAIVDVKRKVRFCKVCGNFTENESVTSVSIAINRRSVSSRSPRTSLRWKNCMNTRVYIMSCMALSIR